MRTAKIKKSFLSLFLYQSEIEDDYVEIDHDCICSFDAGTEVEVLREIAAGAYAETQKSYVILNPINNESITLVESFLDFND